MRQKLAMLTMAALVLSLAAAGAVAGAGDDDGKQVRKIEIQGLECEDGEDCEHGLHHVIEIDEDGLARLLGGDHEWLADAESMKAYHLLPGVHAGGFLGVQLTELTPDLRVHFGVPEESGVMVSQVVEESAAQRAGIEVGDIITLVEGEGVESARALAGAIGAHEEGEAVTLELWRDGQMRQVTATLDERQGLPVMPRVGMMHGGGAHGMHPRIQKRIRIQCDDADEDCALELGHLDLDLDLDLDCEAEDCDVRVLCQDEGECECSVNGDDVDCASLGVPGE